MSLLVQKLDILIQELKATIERQDREIKFLKEEHECNLLIQRAQRLQIEQLKNIGHDEQK